MIDTIIVSQVLGGASSTGIEVEKIYNYREENSPKSTIYIVAESFITSDRIITPISETRRGRTKISEILMNFLGIDLRSASFSESQISSYKYVNERIKIIGFSSSVDFFVVNIFENLNRRFQNIATYSLHFFDPLPAKKHWGERKMVRNAKIRFLKKKLAPNYQLYSASKEMSEYMSKLYSRPFGTRHLMAQTTKLEFKKPENENNTILYLGSIYGKRSLGFLPEVLGNLEDWNLNIYGECQQDIENEYITKFKFVDQLNKITRPKLLLDLDIKVKDVYIPGKSYTYLATDIPILVVSPLGSALRTFYGVGGGKLEWNADVGVVVAVNEPIILSEALIKTKELDRSNLFNKRQLFLKREDINDLTELIS